MKKRQRTLETRWKWLSNVTYLFSSSSFMTLTGRWTTSPAAILAITWSGNFLICGNWPPESMARPKRKQVDLLFRAKSAGDRLFRLLPSRHDTLQIGWHSNFDQPKCQFVHALAKMVSWTVQHCLLPHQCQSEGAGSEEGIRKEPAWTPAESKVTRVHLGRVTKQVVFQLKFTHLWPTLS